MDYLVPFKQFNDFTRRTSTRRIDDEDMQARYAAYKEKFSSRQLAQFFVANKDKEWFQEKYHPKKSQPRYEDIKDRRRRYLKTFVEDLEKGVYDDINFDKKEDGAAAANADAAAENENKEEKKEGEAVTATAENGDDADAEYESCLVIKTVPPTIAREKIMEVK